VSFRANGSQPEEKLALRILMEDISERLDADAFKAAIREGKAKWRFMPTLAEIVDAAQPFLTERRQRNREQREAIERAERTTLPAPAYVDPTTEENKAALAFMLGRFAAADKREGVNQAATVDYASGPLVPDIPAFSDASGELKRRRA